MLCVAHRRSRGCVRAVGVASLLGVVFAILVAGCAGKSTELPISTKGTFVSLLRVCRLSPPRDRLLTGCVNGHYDLALQQFSLSTGRRIRTVTPVPLNAAIPAAIPAVGTNAGAILLTDTSGPRCLKDGKPLRGVYAECQPSRNSCINTVMKVSPDHPTPTRLLTVASDQTIGAVVPSPDGFEVAYSAQPCVGTIPLPGLYVRSVRTGKTREIVKTTYCSSIGPPAWNAAGTEVAFRFYASSSPPQPAPVGSRGPGCSEPADATWHLVITKTVPGTRPTRLSSFRRGCSIDAAAFDSTGILVAEGCTATRQSRSFDGAARGRAYLLQYTERGTLTARVPLPYRGLDLEQTLITNEPRSDKILITQDQPNGLVERDDDHVYELSRTHLRQVVEHSWGSDFIAAPW
jgi:hypothetical protein